MFAGREFQFFFTKVVTNKIAIVTQKVIRPSQTLWHEH